MPPHWSFAKATDTRHPGLGTADLVRVPARTGPPEFDVVIGRVAPSTISGALSVRRSEGTSLGPWSAHQVRSEALAKRRLPPPQHCLTGQSALAWLGSGAGLPLVKLAPHRPAGWGLL
jgi:hypothetical protein